jgi:hypothetical protein
MVIRAALLVLGLFHIANGLYMLAAPAAWYAAVPGVTLTGPFNQHFILDIGMAFLASGAGLAWGIRTGRSAAVIACAGAVWPALHALIHVEGWLMHGIAPGTMAPELIGVGGPALFGVALAWLRLKGEPA